MAYLSDDKLLDIEGGFTGWDDGAKAGSRFDQLDLVKKALNPPGMCPVTGR